MKSIKEILNALQRGEIDDSEAEKLIQNRSAHAVGDFAVLDHDREGRTGTPEVVFAESKSASQLVSIVNNMLESNNYALITRANQKKQAELSRAFPDHEIEFAGSEDHLTVLIHSQSWKPPEKTGKIAVLTAGTSDVPYAKEVEYIAKVLGVNVISFYDVGVAGIHRLIQPIEKIHQEQIDAVVVLAGMEGALPTVVASLLDIPVIGLPVPTGYGFGGQGKTALASMLQSCAPGLAVVNIGNGLGAGAIACLIAKKAATREV